MKALAQTQATVVPKQIFSHGNSLQRKCACGGAPGFAGECEECRKKKQGTLQRTATHGGQLNSVPPSVHDVLQSPGKPLNVSNRSFMEKRFGYDFSQVRVHTDAKANQSAREVNALAYTVGKDIVFDAGHFAPDSSSGRQLLAHELTHVVQQRGQPVGIQHSLVVGEANDDAEKEANATAKKIASGEDATIEALSVGTLQRQVPDQTSNTSGTQNAQPQHALTRQEEIELSRTSDGEVAGSTNPFTVSLYNFAINDANLKPRHTQVLREIADMLSLSPTVPPPVRITMRGHADDTGEPVVNDPLSRRRVLAVQRALLQQFRMGDIQISWAGENEPTMSNTTVEGRSRNRRVDIQFEVTSPTNQNQQHDNDTNHQQDQDHTDDNNRGRRTDDGGGENNWFCIEHPILCGIGLLPLVCLLFPEVCIPRPQLTGRRPCLDGLPDLPRGVMRVDTIHPYPFPPNSFAITTSFNMRLQFKNDSTGCDCSLGEYMQQVKGFVMRDGGTGNMRDDPPNRLPRLVGGRLDRSQWREDLRGGVAGMPYGMRDAPESDYDIFASPDRNTGCTYHGHDEPRVVSTIPGERIHFMLEFRGRAVDRRNRDSDIMAVTGWRHWVFQWQGRVPPRQQPPPPPPPPTGGGSGVRLTPHRPATTNPGSTHDSFYAGGDLPRNPDISRVLHTYTITLGFHTETGETAFTHVEVRVISANDTTIFVESTNNTNINVAPETVPPQHEIILRAHARFGIPKSAIDE